MLREPKSQRRSPKATLPKGSDKTAVLIEQIVIELVCRRWNAEMEAMMRRASGNLCEASCWECRAMVLGEAIEIVKEIGER